MADIGKRSGLSRRGLLTSFAAAPLALTAGIAPAFQTAPEDAQLNEVQAALKRGGETRLVILGSGAGPNPRVPNRSRYMTSYVMWSKERAYVLDCGLGDEPVRSYRDPGHRCPLDLHQPSSFPTTTSSTVRFF